jgi:hypothetical protein
MAASDFAENKMAGPMRSERKSVSAGGACGGGPPVSKLDCPAERRRLLTPA